MNDLKIVAVSAVLAILLALVTYSMLDRSKNPSTGIATTATHEVILPSAH